MRNILLRTGAALWTAALCILPEFHAVAQTQSPLEAIAQPAIVAPPVGDGDGL